MVVIIGNFAAVYQFRVIMTTLFASNLVTAGAPEAEPVTGTHFAKSQSDSNLRRLFFEQCVWFLVLQHFPG